MCSETSIAYFFIRITLLCYCWMTSLWLVACPCGCGSKTPLSLHPGEQWKYLTRLSHEGHRKVIDTQGRVGSSSLGPRSVSRYSLGLAYAIFADVSVSLEGGFIQNHRPRTRSYSSVEDPTMSVLWTVQRKDFSQLWLPQVELGMSYKPALANASSRQASAQYGMDVFGNGFEEYVPSLSLAWESSAISWSLSQDAVFRSHKMTKLGERKETLRPGITYRSTLGISYTWLAVGTLGFSLQRSVKGLDVRDGYDQQASWQRNHSLALSYQHRVGAQQTLALTMIHSGLRLWDKNTLSAQTLSLTFIQSFFG